MPNWKKLVVSGSDATLNSLFVTNAVTASIVSASSGITGSLFGTSSWARNTLTASYVNPLRQNVIITGSLLVTQSYISKVDYIEFTSASDQPVAAARLGWNDSDGTLSLGLKGGNVDLLIGEAQFAYVYNAEATTLTKGTVVYSSGSQGNRIAVKRASAIGEGLSADTLGIVSEPITAGSTGIIITSGVIPKIDTSAFTAGALLFLSSSALGEITTTKPTPPAHGVRLGYVQRVHPTVGSLYIKVDNGYELDELHNVLDTSTTSSYGDLLVKSGSLWINSKQLTGSYGITGSLTVTQNVSASSFTGSLQGTASWAVSASWAPGGSSTPGGSNTQIQFNSASVFAGTGSFTFNYASESLQQGFSVVASGLYSHAEGDTTQAIGNYSHAEGELTVASGISSHAEGSLTSASANYSHAEGESTVASGPYSHAEGSVTTTLGAYSHAEGTSTIAYGTGSHAEGQYTTASGDYSHAEGAATKTGIQTAYSASISSGVITMSAVYGDTTGNFGAGNKIYIYDSPFDNTYGAATLLIKQSYYSAPNTIVELYNNTGATTKAYILTYTNNNFSTNAGDQTIPGNYSHAEGEQAQAIGDYSHAEGTAIAVGRSSHAEGNSGLAIGNYSHAEGGNTQAIGSFSHAEGNGIAIGYASHAEGTGTSIGYYTHAEGTDTYAGYKGFSSGDIGLSNPGDIYLSHPYGDVSALFIAGNYIILSDSDDDNIYGTVKLQISGSSFDGTNTIISLINTSIATTYASIGLFDDPEPAGADQTYIGYSSHAEGRGAQAVGYYSHAEGVNTHAIADYTHAEGDTTQAIGKNSHAEGESTVAYGQSSHAEGKQTYTGQYGYNSTSISSGVITLDTKYGDVKTYITDPNSSADYIILDDRAYDNIYGIRQYSVAGVGSGTPTVITLVDSGVSTTRATIYAPGVAQPLNADVLLAGDYAHAEGSGSIASGTGSHASGYWTNAYREYSYAGGKGTVAVAPGQTVIGKYNALDFNPGAYDYSFVVGKGSNGNNRHDILRVIPSDDRFYVSASNVQFAGLQDGSGLSQVVMYNPTNGAIAYTASSAFGGGGGPSTPTFPYTGSAIISGSLTITGSLNVTQGITGSLQGTASWATNAVSSSYPLRVSGSTIYSSIATVPASFNAQHSIFIGSSAGDSATNASQSIFLGREAGISATTAHNSNFFGYQAGKGANASNNSNFFGASAGNGASAALQSNFIGPSAGLSAANANSSNFFGSSAGDSATNAAGSNFFGSKAGQSATNALSSNFFGANAGQNATNASGSNFIGESAGGSATSAGYSNFIGSSAGNSATNANYSNIFGYQAGYRALNAAYSTLIGYQAGYSPSTPESIASHNIIIGTNISLPANTSSQLNIGGVLFGSGLYSRPTTAVFTGSEGTGRIGINIVNPNYSLDVSGSGNFTGPLIISSSLTVVTGSGIELQVTNTGVRVGNAITDVHTVTGSLNISGSINILKAGSGSAASFGGSPRTASFTFTTPFINNNYAITVTGEDARTWTVQNKVSGSFVINSNSSVALTGPVYWIATPFNS